MASSSYAIKDISNTKFILIFISIITGGFLLRLIFSPVEIPLVLDSLLYFWYGIELSITGEFPSNYDLTNNMWPTILAPIFSITNFENYLDYMNLQRGISIFFSIITSIPIYFLAKKFLPKNIALLAPLLFIFEPRIVYNSFLGITEPMFLFCIISAFALFFSSSKKYVISSFILIGFSCLVRYESLILIIPMCGILFFRFKKLKYRISYPALAIIIFLVVITPMSIIKIETMGYDGIFSHVIGGANVVIYESKSEVGKIFPIDGTINFFKLLGWILLPTFLIFLPLGIISFFKNKNSKRFELVILSIFSLIPAFYATIRGIEDTRYYFIFFPLLIIFSLSFFEWFTNKWKNKYFKFIFVGFIIITSFGFLSMKDDNMYKSEVFHVVKENFEEIKVVNDIHPYSPYFRTMPLHYSNDFPIEKNQIGNDIVILPIENYDSFYELFNSDVGKTISHIIIDDSETRKDFLQELFTNENKYPFLTKDYDSLEEGLDHHVKIFRFDSAKFINLDTEEGR